MEIIADRYTKFTESKKQIKEQPKILNQKIS